MSTFNCCQLDRISVVDITGSDAAKIVHNLTTNEVKSLELGDGRESFVTDVRGKTLGHCHLFREQGFLRMIGAAGQSERIAAHVDRYTIREDATPIVRDHEFAAIVLPPHTAAVVCDKWDELMRRQQPLKSTCRIGDLCVDAYATRWLGEGTAVLLVPPSDAVRICDAFLSQSIAGHADSGGLGDEASFHHARTLAGFPWFGIDLDETNLPQEADRDPLAISFTKGCYLGQETVARLDALGQVQRKLVRWSITGGVPDAGATLVSGDKTVGRLTSVAADDRGGAIAIGFARRSHFESGATAVGIVKATAAEFIGTVI